MRVIRYYLVEPNARMQGLLSSSSGSELAHILPKSFLFSHKEGGKGFVTLQDHMAWAKLLFLAYLRHEFGSIPECRQIFENASISIEQFDRWWTVERHGVEETLEAVEDGIDSKIAELFTPTGMPLIDEWIACLKQPRDSQPPCSEEKEDI